MFTVVRINNETKLVEWTAAQREQRAAAAKVCTEFNKSRTARDVEDYHYEIRPVQPKVELDVTRG